LADPETLGLGTALHAVPSQCWMNVLAIPFESQKLPTAHALVADVAATPREAAPELGLELGVTVQEVPFQRSISDLASAPSSVWPTAQALVAEVAATALRLACVPGLMAGTMVQALPFQCSVSVRVPAAVLVPPTAQASVADMAASALISPPVPGLSAGVVAADQAVPFHRSISGLIPPSPEGWKPAAHALLAEVAVTAARVLLVPGLGLVTRVQAVPFHRSISVTLPVSVSLVPAAHALAADVAVL
jgi:hypothetical protein